MFGLYIERAGAKNVLWSRSGSVVVVTTAREPEWSSGGAVGLAKVREAYRAKLRYWELTAWRLPCGAADRVGYELDALREDYCLAGASVELLDFDESRVYSETGTRDEEFSSCGAAR